LVIDISALRRRQQTHAVVEQALEIPWLAAALAGTDAEVDAAARTRLDLVIQGDGSVVVTGTVRGGFRVPCARCLEPAAVSADAKVTAMFVREGFARALPDDPDGEEDLADDDGSEDLWPFDGVHLDLSPLLVETVKLAYPMRAFCERGADCRGLCSQCGAPLNEQPADAARCAACGAEDPRVPEVDLVASAEPPKTGALAEALRRVTEGDAPVLPPDPGPGTRDPGPRTPEPGPRTPEPDE
jgi:uncharacterized protein